MLEFKDREFVPPVPRPFPMHAMQYILDEDLNSAQRKQIVMMMLDYFKQCAEAEVQLAEGMMKEINNLDTKR
jgi:hypothetical protein